MENTEKIEAYLNGELSGTDLKDFETLLANDEKLQVEVSRQKEITNFLVDEKRQEFYSTLNKIRNKEARKSVDAVVESHSLIKRGAINRKRIAIAASIIFLLSISFLLYNSNKFSTENLIKENIALLVPNTSSLKSTQKEDIIYQYYEAINQREWNTASKLLEEPNFLEINTPELLYIKGYVNYRLNRYIISKEIFTQIASINSPRSQQALFFTALIELKLDNEAQAIQILNELESSPSLPIKKSAKELNAKLKSPWHSLSF